MTADVLRALAHFALARGDGDTAAAWLRAAHWYEAGGPMTPRLLWRVGQAIRDVPVQGSA